MSIFCVITIDKLTKRDKILTMYNLLSETANDEKVKKAQQGFSLLPDEKQSHVLGVMQALVFAGDGQGDAVYRDSKTLVEGFNDR